MAQAIEDALCMSEEERRERHRQNYMHVQVRRLSCLVSDCLLQVPSVFAVH